MSSQLQDPEPGTSGSAQSADHDTAMMLTGTRTTTTLDEAVEPSWRSDGSAVIITHDPGDDL